MGYFSKKQIEAKEEYPDQSDDGFERQLLWRYEDLKDKYRALLDRDAPACGDECFTADDYRYAPVQHFKTIRDVWLAMEMVKEELVTKCDIIVREEEGLEGERVVQQDPDQVTVFEIVVLPLCLQAVVAV